MPVRSKILFISEGMSMAYLVHGMVCLGTGLFCCLIGSTYPALFLLALLFFALGVGLLISKTGVMVNPAGKEWGTYIEFYGYKKQTWVPIPKGTTALELVSTKERNAMGHGNGTRWRQTNRVNSYEVFAKKGEQQQLLYEFTDYQPAYKFLVALSQANQLPNIDQVQEARQRALERRRAKGRR